jgi:flagellin-like hook-associated protein FlgL
MVDDAITYQIATTLSEEMMTLSQVLLLLENGG